MRMVVTGGAGFIGSHQVLALLQRGHSVHVIDDLSNSSPESLRRVAQLTGEQARLSVVDLRDRDALLDAVDRAQPDAVMHFAARKHVHESLLRPLEYYRVNIGGLLNLIDVLDQAGVRRLVYSSSGSIYGEAETYPIPETASLRPTNAYARTKAQGEQILADVCDADPTWEVTALRYFNPAGAHPSGRMGEDPTGLRTNLLPVLMDVALGHVAALTVYGTDYPTHDGTAVRDYVHVMDVAEAHVAALDHSTPGFRAFNVGRGVGVSVFDLLAAVETTTGVTVDWIDAPRRPGDVTALFGDTTRAAAELGLGTHRPLEEICDDAWRWRQQNPWGYRRPGERAA